MGWGGDELRKSHAEGQGSVSELEGCIYTQTHIYKFLFTHTKVLNVDIVFHLAVPLKSIKMKYPTCPAYHGI